MISPFEPLEPRTEGLPQSMVMEPHLIEERGVSLLEFLAIDALPEVEEEVLIEAPVVMEERTSQVRVMIDAAREEAAREARSECVREFELELVAERDRVTLVAREFARDRERFMAAAETQVVRLALAIARKILAREASADPVFLSAVVKAALARIHDGSGSTLRVSPGSEETWRATLSGVDGELDIVPDEQREAGSVVLETVVGQVELGVRVQMEEIERGFESLMQRRVR